MNSARSEDFDRVSFRRDESGLRQRSDNPVIARSRPEDGSEGDDVISGLTSSHFDGAGCGEASGGHFTVEIGDSVDGQLAGDFHVDSGQLLVPGMLTETVGIGASGASSDACEYSDWRLN